jgi:hypothetical protein
MSQASDPEKRVKARKRLQLRVDARIITEQERIDILAGLGHPDLDNEGLALSRPRWGMVRTASEDVSASGLRLQVSVLGELSPGSAMSLDVHLPGERRVVKLLGDVMWAGQQEGQAVAGLRIAALELEGHQRLVQTLQGGPEI